MLVRIKVTCSENKRKFQENKRKLQEFWSIYKTGIQSFGFSQIKTFFTKSSKKKQKVYTTKQNSNTCRLVAIQQLSKNLLRVNFPSIVHKDNYLYLRLEIRLLLDMQGESNSYHQLIFFEICFSNVPFNKDHRNILK